MGLQIPVGSLPAPPHVRERMLPRFYWLAGFGWAGWVCDGFAAGAVASGGGETQLIDPITLGPYCTYEVPVSGEMRRASTRNI